MSDYTSKLSVLLRGSSPQLVAMLVLSLVSVAFDLLCLLLLPVFVLLALGVENFTQLPIPFLEQESLTHFAILIVCLFLVRAVYMLCMGAAMAALSETVRLRLVARLFESILWRPYEVAITQAESVGITAITSYSSSFTQTVVLSLFRLVADLMTIIAMLSFLAIKEPLVVGLASTVLIAVGSAYYFSVRRINDRQSRLLADMQIALTQHAKKALGAPREIRIFGVQDNLARSAGKTLSRLAIVRAWLGAIYVFPRALGELTLIGLAIAYMIVNSYAGTDFEMIASSLSMIAFAGLRILPAFAQSMTNVGLLRSGRIIAERLVAILKQGEGRRPAPKRAGSVSVRDEAFESLEMRDITFSYSNSPEEVFSGATFGIRAGESVGVLGASGAGKSTLGDLLLGLLEPEGGEIWVNGKPAKLDNPDWWKVVGFVPQAPYIANDSLLRNVAFGLPATEIDKDKVESCLRMACLGELLEALPQGLETVLGDSGARLSGGQRQRVAIARTLYWERDVLVLDEATSALDSETEAEVIRAIEALKGKVTTVIIAHRLSTLANCDRVYEVRNGGVVEVGSGRDVAARG